MSGAAMVRRAPSGGFSLIEILLVIAIVIMAMAMATLYNGRRDKRHLLVRTQAEQLAAVMRQARAMAMEQKATYGVAFNITNTEGSSGRVLSNGDGGHFYRIIGPSRNTGQMDYHGLGAAYSTVFKLNRDHLGWLEGRDYPLRNVLGEIAADWIGEKRVLPKGEVRFVALADQDNGNLKHYAWHFGPTYPRPWFGHWDAGTGRLYAWGGYDPEIKDFDQPFAGGPADWWRARTGAAGTVSFTGFYYEGDDGPVEGCRNPVDRHLLNDTDGDGVITVADQKTLPLYVKGEPRPLVNADWLDAVILFYPDGSARYEEWCDLRHEYAKYSRSVNDWHLFFQRPAPADERRKLTNVAMVDRCNMLNHGWWANEASGVPGNMRQEASHYVARTGFWYITLGGDIGDAHTFASAQAAHASLFPLFRVGVNRLGEVRVVEVKRRMPEGTVLDDVRKDGWWEGRPCGLQGYWDHLLGGAMPAEDFVTPAMLEHRQWWITP